MTEPRMDVTPSPQELVLKELKRLQKAYKRDRNVANSKYGRDFFIRTPELVFLKHPQDKTHHREHDAEDKGPQETIYGKSRDYGACEHDQ